MNEFEKQMLEMMQNFNSRFDGIENEIKGIKSDITGIKSEIKDIKSDIEEMKEDLTITRTAANYNGEKLEELVGQLKEASIIA